jgi:hypothetical protein
MDMYPQSYTDNRLESIIELYDAACADYMFNYVMNSIKTSAEKIVSPISIGFD